MTSAPQPADFADIARLIATARQQAVQAVNTLLIELYWQIGERISRELERQFKTALFERTVLHPPKVSPLVTQIHPDVASVFKDSYLVELNAE